MLVRVMVEAVTGAFVVGVALRLVTGQRLNDAPGDCLLYVGRPLE